LPAQGVWISLPVTGDDISEYLVNATSILIEIPWGKSLPYAFIPLKMVVSFIKEAGLDCRYNI
jgi:hypothetical protein